MSKGQSLKNGTAVGQYSIVRLIGKGGMGEVYQAFDKNLLRKVALKVISPEHADDPAIASRFELEGRTLAKVSHPNLVVVYNFGRQESLYFIAMEYVEGRSLGDLIKEGYLAPKDAVPIFIQMLDGIAYLHRTGIIHRDLKSANILIQKNRQVKIVDFGIAKNFHDEVSDITRVGEFIGSVHYAAPETTSANRWSSQSDIWSLGIIFYEMLVGKKPFRGQSLLEIVDKVKTRPIKFPPDAEARIPKSLQNIILKMCAKPLDQRSNDILALQKELSAILEVEIRPTVAQEEGPSLPTDEDFPTKTEKLVENMPTMTSVSQPPAVPEAAPSDEKTVLATVVEEFFAALPPMEHQKTWLRTHQKRLSIAAAAIAFVGFLFFMAGGSSTPPSIAQEVQLKLPSQSSFIWNNPSKPKVAFSWASSIKDPLRLQVATDKEFQSLVLDIPVSKSPHITQQLTPEKNYYWRLVSATTLAVSNPIEFTVLDMMGPSLIQPIGGVALSTSDGSDINFTWRPKFAAAYYRFQVARDEKFASLVQDKVTTDTTFNLPNLPSGRYFWRVKVDGREGSKDQWSEVARFSLAPPLTISDSASSRPPRIETGRPGAPRLTRAKQVALLEFEVKGRNPASVPKLRVAPELKWEKVDGSSRYQIEISPDAEFEDTLISTKTSSPDYEWTSAKPGTYYWRVRAINKQGSGGPFSPVGVLTLNLPAPVLKATYKQSTKVTPKEYSYKKVQLTIDWQPVPMASKYKILVAEDDQFTRQIQSFDTSSNNVKISIAKPGRYYLRLATLNGQGQIVSSFAESNIQVEKNMALARPEVKAPQNGAIMLNAGGAVPIVFIWRPVPDAQYYEIQFSQDPKFSNPFYSKRINDVRLLYSGNMPGNDLYWRVRAGYSDYQSEWTKPFRLKHKE